MGLGSEQVLCMVLFKSRTKTTLAQFREELDEHLSAINENTSEIQGNYSYAQKVEQRMEQMMLRLDHIEQLLAGNKHRFSVQPFTYY